MTGYQTTYQEGLAALDEAAGGSFAARSGPERDLILRSSGDPRIEAIIDVAFPHTLEFMYGPPEYGGNRDLVSWEYTRWQGDVQPRGWTREEVEDPEDTGPAGPLRDLPPDVTEADLVVLAPLASPEVAHGLVMQAGGSLRSMESIITRVAGQRPSIASDDAVRAAIAAVAAAITEDRRGG